MYTSLKQVALAAILAVTSLSASAWDGLGKVVEIEPVNLPTFVIFKLDTTVGDCPSGNWIYYYGTTYSTDPVKNVAGNYAALLTALHTGKKVWVFGSTTCTAVHIHPTNQ